MRYPLVISHSCWIFHDIPPFLAVLPLGNGVFSIASLITKEQPTISRDIINNWQSWRRVGSQPAICRVVLIQSIQQISKLTGWNYHKLRASTIWMKHVSHISVNIVIVTISQPYYCTHIDHLTTQWMNRSERAHQLPWLGEREGAASLWLRAGEIQGQEFHGMNCSCQTPWISCFLLS